MDFEAKDILDVCPYLCLQLNWIGYIGPSISKGLKVKAAHVAPKRSDAMALKVKVRYGRNPHLTFTQSQIFWNVLAVYVVKNFFLDCDS